MSEVTVAPASLVARGTQVVAAKFNLLAMFCVVVILGATVFDVSSRYLLDAPTSWATEISTYALVASIFLAAAHTHLNEGNVRVDLLMSCLGPDGRRSLTLIAAWAGLIFVAGAAWQMWLMVLSDHRNGSRLMGMLLMPSWLPKLPIVIGLTLLCAALLVEIERAASYAGTLRRNAPYIVAVLLCLVLIGFGVRPPLVPGTRFDSGSLAIVLAILIGAAVSGPKVFVGTALVAVGGWAALYLGKQVGPGFVTLMMGLCIVIALAIGVRIAFVLGLVGMLSIYFLSPIPFPVNVASRIWNATNSFALIAVPMFVLMGSLLLRSGLSKELFAVLVRPLSRLPGGLAHAGMAGCGIFSAVSGSSVATAATIGSVACPEMLKRGYSPAMAYGSIAGGGTLGILIPPSVPLIIYGMTVGVPITAMFIAGILPGLLMMLCFTVVTIIWAMFQPSAAPKVAAGTEPVISRDSYLDTALLALLILLVIASLYLGIATPSETGAIGALLAFLVCLARGRLTVQNVKEALEETVTVTSFIFLIVSAANILTFGFDYLKISQALMTSATAVDLGRWEILIIVLAVYVVLGMFLDSISMLVLTLPIVFPLIVSLGFDPVWFGIVLVIMAEIGLVTPPVGMNLFVLQGINKTISIRTIALGTAPYIGAMAMTVLLLCLYPQIALWLTQHLK